MPTRVVSENEVNINGTYFPIIGQVQEFPQNIFPPKRVDGDYTRDSNPRLSSMTFSDFRGGIGLDVMQGSQTDRCFSSTCSIRFQRSLTLGPLVITSDSAAPPTDGGVFVLGQQNSFAWAVWGNDIYAYGDIADNWSDSTEEAGAGGAFVSDTLNMQLDNNDYLIIATTTGYRHHRGSNIATNWGTSTKDVVYLASWDDRLWGINIKGDLWYSFIPGTETDAGELKSNISDATPRRLFTGPDANGEQILYALSDDGLFAYDAANQRFLKTNIPLQFGTRGGIGGAFNSGAGLWNSLIYLSVNTSIYEYNPFQGAVRLIGPNDVDDGLATNRRGTMTSLAFSTKELFVVVTAHSTDATADSVYAWSGRGWYEIFSTTDTNDTIKDIRVLSGSETTAYRLWIGQSGTTDAALYIDLPTNFENPKQTTDYVYAAAGELRTPWFHADQVDVNKLGFKVKVETADTSTSGTVETVKVEYAIDYDEGSSDANYLTLANSTFTDGLIDTDTTGVTTTEFLFPRDSVDVTVDPVGKVFKAIRFKISLARGGTTTNSPRLVSLTLEYRKKLDHKQGFRVQLDLRKGGKGTTSASLRSALQTILESETLVEFTYRNDTGDSRNFFVDTFLQQGIEQTGFNESGTVVVDLLEA